MLVDTSIAHYLVLSEDPIEIALRRITSNKSRVVFVVNNNGVLIGSLTDGDFRRWIVGTEKPTLSAHCSILANHNCIFLKEGDSYPADDLIFSTRIGVVPIVDHLHRVVAIGRPRTPNFSIGARHISHDSPVFVVAEIGINHNGSLEVAKQLVDAAANAGADCAKFQMRDMDTLYRAGTFGFSGEDLGVEYTLDLLGDMYLSHNDLLKALDYVREVGLTPLCTPWDEKSAQLLVQYGLPALKISSADLTNHRLLQFAVSSQRPVILSTGMSSEAEIVEAVNVLRHGTSPYALLHCNSTYPSPFGDIRLGYMDRLAEIGNCLVGYSGHERGHHVSVAAVARGARIIEKHITLDRNGRGSDNIVSLEPHEFARMVREIRDTEVAIPAEGPRLISQGERTNRITLAKSIVAKYDLAVGHEITEQDLQVRSPGRGLQPNMRSKLIGISLRRPIKAGDFFYETDIAPPITRARPYFFTRQWGLPVRFHDYKDLMKQSNPNFLEFHLSYRDLAIDIKTAIPDRLDSDLIVHSPDLFQNDLILDLAADDLGVRTASVKALDSVISFTKRLRERFLGPNPPKVIVSMGGSSKDRPLPHKVRPKMYERIMETLDSLDLSDVDLAAQTLPPFPWYLGGQRFCNLFVDPVEIANFSGRFGVKICFDTSHAMLACNHHHWSFSTYLETVGPYISHLHIADAAGVDGEGLQINSGEIDFPALGRQLRTVAPHASFIPEIWQGHKNEGADIWLALERLELLL